MNFLFLKKRFTFLVSTVSFCATIFCSCSYQNQENLTFLIQNARLQGITFENYNSTIVISPKDKTENALIFYPGGAVNYESYISLLTKCAANGIKCFLLQMPHDLAILNITAANGLIEKNPEISNWYIGGHSLGGAISAYYMTEYAENYKGLILLAAYSDHDISDKNLKVLSIYGENDLVLNKELYSKNFHHLPTNNIEEHIIQGGNHGNFGTYGHQNGDGNATISADEQQEQTALLIKNFIEKRDD